MSTGSQLPKITWDNNKMVKVTNNTAVQIRRKLACNSRSRKIFSQRPSQKIIRRIWFWRPRKLMERAWGRNHFRAPHQSENWLTASLGRSARLRKCAMPPSRIRRARGGIIRMAVPQSRHRSWKCRFKLWACQSKYDCATGKIRFSWIIWESASLTQRRRILECLITRSTGPTRTTNSSMRRFIWIVLG